MSPDQSIEERIERFCELCRDNDLKVTHQRLEIYRALAMSTDHPSAEEVYQTIKEKLPTISFDTVYRTLSLFEKYGLIRRVHQLDDRNRFDSNLEIHHHFICVRCKTVDDFYWTDFDHLEFPVNGERWGMVHSKRVELRGVCKKCMEQQRDEITK